MLLPGVLTLVLINCFLDNKFLEGRDQVTRATVVLFPVSGAMPGKERGLHGWLGGRMNE